MLHIGRSLFRINTIPEVSNDSTLCMVTRNSDERYRPSPNRFVQSRRSKISSVAPQYFFACGVEEFRNPASVKLRDGSSVIPYTKAHANTSILRRLPARVHSLWVMAR